MGKETIATLTQEIAALTAGIKALDKSVAEATTQRKDENTEYKALIASDTAATKVLEFAKNRLNKFYNPKLYKAPPKVELSAGDRIYENEGGVIATAAPGGIAGTGIKVFAQVSAHQQHKVAPGPPPSTWGAYASKSEENTGVIGMIDLLIADLAKEMTEAKTDEADSQADYETMMKDSAAKRTTDSKALTAKGGAKADTEAALQAHNGKRADAGKELMATEKYIASLHAECDWLLQYFDARKAARAGEVESLKQAKAVLSGADYSLLQQNVRRTGFLAKKGATCKVEGEGISADMTTEHNYYSQAGGGEWTFSGAGMLKVANGACPLTDDFPHNDVSQSFAHGAESGPDTFSCSGACCVRFCCGSRTC